MSLGQVDGQAGAQRLLDAGRWTSGMCLEAVWVTSGAGPSDSPGSYGSARDWWARCPEDRKHADRTPPAGALLRFSNGSADGHICYSLGGESAASTDKPSAGLTGITSISEIEHSWGGRVYEGWTDWLGGWDVKTAASAPPVAPAKTNDEGEETMKPNLAHWNDDEGAKHWIQFVPGTKWILEWTEAPDDAIATGLAQQQDHPASGVGITESMRDAIVAAAKAA